MELCEENRDYAVLSISEMYWLIKDEYFFEVNPQNKFRGYDDICWNFYDDFIEIFCRTYGRFQDDPTYLFQIGVLMYLDASPFWCKAVNKEYGDPYDMSAKMLEKAGSICDEQACK